MAVCKALALCLALIPLMSFSEAREFHVVDDNASWQIPSFPHVFDKWAQINRFVIGDSIFLKYDGKADSVLEVSEADYNACSRSNPIKSYNDGNTRITLDKSGSFFFISGADGHCEKGQKLQMRVLSANHHHRHRAPAPAPSPLANNHNHHHAPAPAPAHHSAAAKLRAGVVVAAALALALTLV